VLLFSHLDSFMAYQTVCQPGNLIIGLFQVAIQAPAHIHLNDRASDCHVANVTMTGFTIDACPQMRLMAEVDEIGLLAYPVPRNWLSAFPIASQGLDCVTVGSNDAMAAHTFCRGYTGYI
jgi:hypothetical protein